MNYAAFEERFRLAMPNASEAVAEVAVRTLEVANTQSKDSSRIVVLTRVFKAVLGILEKIDSGKVASASSDFEVILSLLEEPGVLAILAERDPLANAKCVGLEISFCYLKQKADAYLLKRPASLSA